MKHPDYEGLFHAMREVDAWISDLVDSSYSEGELDWLCFSRDKLIAAHKNILSAMAYRKVKEISHNTSENCHE